MKINTFDQTVYLQEGYLSNGHFLVSVAWVESLGDSPLMEVLKASQIHFVTAKITGDKTPVASKSLEVIVKDLSLKNYRPVNMAKVDSMERFKSVDSQWSEDTETYDYDFKGETEIFGYCFKVPGQKIQINISAHYFGILIADPKAVVMAKRYDRPVAVVKDGITVALVMPFKDKYILDMERNLKNAKSK